MSSHEFRFGSSGVGEVSGYQFDDVFRIKYRFYEIDSEIAYSNEFIEYEFSEALEDFILTCWYAFIFKGPYYERDFCVAWVNDIKNFRPGASHTKDTISSFGFTLELDGVDGEKIAVALSSDGLWLKYNLSIPKVLLNERNELLRGVGVLDKSSHELVEVKNREDLGFSLSLFSLRSICNFVMAQNTAFKAKLEARLLEWRL